MSATPTVATPEETNHCRGRRGRRRGDHELGRSGGDVLACADPGPEGHPRLGAWVRRRRHAPRRARVGREGADALADHPGGRQDRALRLRSAGAVLRRPDRPDAADRQRGAVLGRRRHRHVDHGHRPRRRRDLRPGHGRADRRVDPALLRHAEGDLKVAAFCASEPNAGSDVSGVRTRAKFDEAAGEWVINGQKAWATNGGISDVHVSDRHRRPRAWLQRARGIRRADERSEGHLPGHEGLQARPARLPYRRCLPRRLPHPRRLRARRQGQARRAPRPRARGQEGQLPGGDADVRVLAPYGRLAGARDRPRSLRVLPGLRQGARAVRQQDHREPVDRVHARAHEARDRRDPPARLACLLDGPQPGSVRERRGLDVQAQGRRGRRLGRPSVRSRSSAATATRASSRSSAGTATPRSTTSSRGLRRSSSS